jgi:hypothetical protein
MQMMDQSKAPMAISNEPVGTLSLPYESARMLAVLPRTKYYNESTAAAFAGTIAALPSAVSAILHAAQRNTFGLEIFETIQVLIFFGFLVWLFASLLYSRQEKTAGEYLDELYRPSPNTADGTPLSTSR